MVEKIKIPARTGNGAPVFYPEAVMNARPPKSVSTMHKEISVNYCC